MKYLAVLALFGAVVSGVQLHGKPLPRNHDSEPAISTSDHYPLDFDMTPTRTNPAAQKALPRVDGWDTHAGKSPDLDIERIPNLKTPASASHDPHAGEGSYRPLDLNPPRKARGWSGSVFMP